MNGLGGKALLIEVPCVASDQELPEENIHQLCFCAFPSLCTCVLVRALLSGDPTSQVLGKARPPSCLNPPGHHASHFPSSVPHHELLCLHGLIPTNLLAYCHFSHLTSKQLLIPLFLFQLLEATPSSVLSSKTF